MNIQKYKILDFINPLTYEDLISGDRNLSINESILALTIHDEQLNDLDLDGNFFYSQFVKTEEGKREYLEFEGKVIKAFQEITLKHNLYYISLDYDGYYYSKDFQTLKKDDDKLRDLIKLCLRKELFAVFVIPERKTVILTGYDLTWTIHTFNEGREDDELISLLRKNGLNIFRYN